MKIDIRRVKHEASGLFCEDIPDAHKHVTYVYLVKDATDPVRICKSRLELAAYLGGWADCKKSEGD